MKFYILIPLLYLWTSLSWGAKPFLEGYDPQPLSIEAENVMLQGYRFEPQRGKIAKNAVLLLPGLSSNFHEFQALIPKILEAGYRVYPVNFRGQGKGNENSRVINYKDKDYGFKKMVEVDVVAMVNKVFEETGEKVIVGGHSMGGMVITAAVGEGLLKGKVQSIFAIGSPPHLNSQKNFLNRSLREFGAIDFDFGSGSDPYDLMAAYKLTEQFGSLIPFFSFIKELARPVVQPVIETLIRPYGILENYNPKLDTFAEDAYNPVPRDIFRSLNEYVTEGYPYVGLPLDVPIMHIIGEEDGVAPREDVFENALIQAGESGHWFWEGKNVSHIDLITTKVVNAFFGFLKKFMKRPSSLGTKNETYITSGVDDPGQYQILDCQNALEGLRL